MMGESISSRCPASILQVATSTVGEKIMRWRIRREVSEEEEQQQQEEEED